MAEAWQRRSAETRRQRQHERLRRLRVVLVGWYRDGWSIERIARTIHVRRSRVRLALMSWLPDYAAEVHRRRLRSLRQAWRALGRVSVWAIVLLGVAGPAIADHGSWQDHYRGWGGLSCCGERDCEPAEVWVWRRTPTAVEVEVNRVLLTLPSGWVHTIPPEVPVPPEITGYWCRMAVSDRRVRADNTRCVFVRAGQF